MAVETDALYQWLNCDNEFEPIEGETNQLFIPTQTGNYAVEITVDSCSIISECVEVIIVSTQDHNARNRFFKVYPNPATNRVQIEVDPYYIGKSLTLFDSYSRPIVSRQITQTTTNIDISNLPQALYILRIENEEAIKIIKL